MRVQKLHKVLFKVFKERKITIDLLNHLQNQSKNKLMKKRMLLFQGDKC